jgi:8-oxo-dGTP diphosphatase
MSESPPIDWSQWVPGIHATLMFIVREGRILLIEKKRGHGAGKINGPGGKIDPGETPLESVIRETQEELLITPLAPLKLGELHFHMSDMPHIICHVYRAENFTGTPTETEEAVPIWFQIADIPYDRMWEDDRYWLPQLLEKRSFEGRFSFDGDRMLSKEVLLKD